MLLGNLPNADDLVLGNKRYWRFAIGRNAMPHRYFENGWYGFDFVILKKQVDRTERGASIPTAFRISFAFWLPIYPL